MLKLKAAPEGYARRMVVELWLYAEVAAESRASLTECGIEIGGAQTTKTRKALQFFCKQLKPTG